MSDIKLWSSAAASNNASVPNGWPEGMAPSGVNDSARELMASVRRWYEDAQWTDLGHTPTYVSTLTFTLAGDKTGIYEIGRRIRAKVGSSTLYGTIDSSTYTAATGVYCSLDSGGFTASLSAIAVSILTNTNRAYPHNFSDISASSVVAANINVSSVAKADAITHYTSATSTASGSGVTIDGLLVKAGGLPSMGMTGLKYYDSGEQSITGAGALTLAHGLGATPVIVQMWLKCTTGENGYSIGDVVLQSPFDNSALGVYGAVITVDATNINVKYSAGPDGHVFNGLNKSDGTSINFTNNNWNAIFRAWA